MVVGFANYPGGLVLSGGLVGFLFSRNPVTLTSGVLYGGPLLALSFWSLKIWRKGKSSLPFILGQAGNLLFLMCLSDNTRTTAWLWFWLGRMLIYFPQRLGGMGSRNHITRVLFCGKRNYCGIYFSCFLRTNKCLPCLNGSRWWFRKKVSRLTLNQT